jgi:hypothetical protein
MNRFQIQPRKRCLGVGSHVISSRVLFKFKTHSSNIYFVRSHGEKKPFGFDHTFERAHEINVIRRFEQLKAFLLEH